jgi:asparagine synthase (glutamine-hydrolysing)
MCGICGAVRLGDQEIVPASTLGRMTAAQRHRGPDDQGYLSLPAVGFGFCRLAILDLTPAGHQPMSNEDGTVWLVYNGEIYNFQELVPILEQRGHHFRSRCDSEVIIHAYEEWGTECIRRLNGMFAFAIFDSRRRRVFIARDRLGVKPLYYWSDGATFVFGSELKSVLAYPEVPRQLSTPALQAYLIYEYVPGPESIFTGIHRLPAGHYLEVQLDGRDRGRHTADWHAEQYWDVRFRPDAPGRWSVEEYACELRELLRAAVKRRLISDVPLGAFLSGGIDSSSIVALMAEVGDERPKTFSIGFEEETFCELQYAHLVARHFGTDHHVEILRPDAHDVIQAVADLMDEPFADASALPTYLVSQAARRHVTVALAGDAGDELFAGYDWYRAQRVATLTLDHLPQRVRGWLRGWAQRIPPAPQKKGLRNIARRYLEGASLAPAMQHARWQSFQSEEDLARLLNAPTPYFASGTDPALLELVAASGSPGQLDQQQYTDIKRYLADDILFKVDRMSMAVSLETRGPFLDYTLVEFAARLPPALRLRGLSTKYLLKRAMRGILPPEILTRRKLGFNLPYKNWLRTGLRDLLVEKLESVRLRQQGLFRPDYVQLLVTEHLAGRRDHAHQLWPLLMFQLWADRYLTAASPGEVGAEADAHLSLVPASLGPLA